MAVHANTGLKSRRLFSWGKKIVIIIPTGVLFFSEDLAFRQAQLLVVQMLI